MHKRRDKQYIQLHEQLAQEYGYSSYAIYVLRGELGKGITKKELVEQQKEGIENKQLEIRRILARIKTSNEIIEMLTMLDEKTLTDILERQP